MTIYLPANEGITRYPQARRGVSEPPPIDNPGDIADLFWWFDSEANMTLGAGGNVNEWQGRPEGERQPIVRQETSANKPGLYQTGGQLGDGPYPMATGKPYIAAIDASDSLQGGVFSNYPTFVNFTFFQVLYVANALTGVSTQYYLEGEAIGGQQSFQFRRHASPLHRIYWYWIASGNDARSWLDVPTDTWCMVTLRGAPNSWRTAANGGQDAVPDYWCGKEKQVAGVEYNLTQRPTGDVYRSVHKLGVLNREGSTGGTFEDGALAAFLAYDRQLDDTEVRQVQNYLIEQYGTELEATP